MMCFLPIPRFNYLPSPKTQYWEKTGKRLSLDFTYTVSIS